MKGVMETVERVAGDSARISRAYVLAAWITLAISVLAWSWFAMAAIGFYVSAIYLKREGL